MQPLMSSPFHAAARSKCLQFLHAKYTFGAVKRACPPAAAADAQKQMDLHGLKAHVVCQFHRLL